MVISINRKPTLEKKPGKFGTEIARVSFSRDSLLREFPDDRVRAAHVMFDALYFTQVFLKSFPKSPPIWTVTVIYNGIKNKTDTVVGREVAECGKNRREFRATINDSEQSSIHPYALKCREFYNDFYQICVLNV